MVLPNGCRQAADPIRSMHILVPGALTMKFNVNLDSLSNKQPRGELAK